MIKDTVFGNAKWIWPHESDFQQNEYAEFVYTFKYESGKADLFITADSRYWLYVNGERIGFGPTRAYPAHYKYDIYDLSLYLHTGENEIRIVVNHFGISNFQYILAPGGLLVRLDLEKRSVVSDATWKSRVFPNLLSCGVPRISTQQQYEEVFDANAADFPYVSAVELRDGEDGIHQNLEAREIPFFSRNNIYPARLILAETIVQPLRYISFDCQKYMRFSEFDASPAYIHCAFLIRFKADKTAKTRPVWVDKIYNVILNGREVGEGDWEIKQGENYLYFVYNGMIFHPQFAVSFLCDANFSETKIYKIGNFALLDDRGVPPDNFLGFAHEIKGNIDSKKEKKIKRLAAENHIEDLPAAFVTDISDCLHTVNVFCESYRLPGECSDSIVKQSENLLGGQNFCEIVCGGKTVRLTVDFGKETVGYIQFECYASAGTIIDFHNFEFIQPDGRYNYAEGMNNTLRYICKEGRQRYTAMIRRGFRLSEIIVRNCAGSFYLKGLNVEEALYPQRNVGEFICSDYKLNKIYDNGVNTLRCCMEDTYVDCPTYEQTAWVGDARNEALIDWVRNGDRRLWLRNLILTGESLDYSPITQSQAVSGWYNLLPAWTFLWMRSCWEYYFYTADNDGAKRLLDFLKKNHKGVEGFIAKNGLLLIDGWNMFDWANMDTPHDGYITHINCLAVLAIECVAKLAEALGDLSFAEVCRATKERIADSVNRLLWNKEKRAYADCARCISGEFVQSNVFSQQTNTVAYISGVAQGERKELCRRIMREPPQGFVCAGSPFFEFFKLEAFIKEGDEQYLEDICRHWGFMSDTGADTFWEMWSQENTGSRLTRSHCHGWSAAPVYFLSEYVLGVRPLEPGYKKTLIRPLASEIGWCRGQVPTPYGPIKVQWKNEGGKTVIDYSAPREVEIVM